MLGFTDLIRARVLYGRTNPATSIQLLCSLWAQFSFSVMGVKQSLPKVKCTGCAVPADTQHTPWMSAFSYFQHTESTEQCPALMRWEMERGIPQATYRPTTCHSQSAWSHLPLPDANLAAHVPSTHPSPFPSCSCCCQRVPTSPAAQLPLLPTPQHWPAQQSLAKHRPSRSSSGTRRAAQQILSMLRCYSFSIYPSHHFFLCIYKLLIDYKTLVLF